MQVVAPMTAADWIWSVTKYEAVWAWQHKEMLIGGGLGAWRLIKSGKAFFTGQLAAEIGKGIAPIHTLIADHEKKDAERETAMQNRFLDLKEKNGERLDRINNRMDGFVVGLNKISDKLSPHFGD